VMHKFIC